MRKRAAIMIVSGAVAALFMSACQTKSAMQREQDFATMKKEFRRARGDSADVKQQIEDMRTELAQMGGVLEQTAELHRKQLEDIRSEVTSLQESVANLEREKAEQASRAEAAKKAAAEARKFSYATGKRLFDARKYEDAARVFAAVIRNNPDSDDARNAQFHLAESHYKEKDYTSSALEFAEFRKQYPKDKRIPTAIYRQARSFKLMGKKKEAKLFFRELTDRYPKSSLTKHARKELKSLQ